MSELKIGDRAPDFTAETTEGKVSLKDYRGKNLVVYFYVKDQTPGCTMQSCSLRDGIEKIRELRAEVLGVSVDDLASHEKFKAAYNLNFPLVADTDYSISKAFGAFNEERQMSKRMTFVIDKDGIIRHIFPKVDVRAHAEEVAEALKVMK
ncbi:MAG: peroxiredoxin [Nitrososphaerales archaeon]